MKINEVNNNFQNQGNKNIYVINAGGTPSIQEGIYAKMPPPMIEGRLYLATDQGIIYRDTGKQWVFLQLGPQGPRGFPGPTGSPGISYITGIGAPTCDIGQIGDIYINTCTGQMYLKLDASNRPSCTWIEYVNNPVYDTLTPAYYQTVRYDQFEFAPYGPAAFYKMWYDYDSNGGIAMATSPDGINWTTYPQNLTGLSVKARHSRVLFSRDGFGNNTPYRIWYWDTLDPYIIGNEPQMIRTAVSVDGINWTQDQTITQDQSDKLIPFSIYTGSYGPADVLYYPENSSLVLDKTNPFNNRYVMYYDVTNGSIEEIALAVSTDGLYWARIGNQPVLPRGCHGQWDENYACEGAVVIRTEPNCFKMWYSGGVDSSHEGIGCASSNDGIHWTKYADNPIFSIFNNVAWRTARTYNPWVIYDPLQFSGHGDAESYKFWLTGGNILAHPDIGYAAMNSCYWLPLK
ncbi:hypothetical protein [Clostridium sp. YIM B02551]|uniref:hypothetical protein n=1 Tax=Clostridium sp. YIM B02551 TaxID=2910679 RepID=UPI001EEBB0E9|nr:hypothetical protein [Clostridium sp. YIM B02551]